MPTMWEQEDMSDIHSKNTIRSTEVCCMSIQVDGLDKDDLQELQASST